MTRWTSRIVTIVMLGLLLAAGTAAYDRQKLAWLDTTPADQVVAYQRHLSGHSYIFAAISMIVMLSLLLFTVEGMSWCLWKIIGEPPRDHHADARRSTMAARSEAVTRLHYYITTLSCDLGRFVGKSAMPAVLWLIG